MFAFRANLKVVARRLIASRGIQHGVVVCEHGQRRIDDGSVSDATRQRERVILLLGRNGCRIVRFFRRVATLQNEKTAARYRALLTPRFPCILRSP